MPNFSIATQVRTELDKFDKQYVRLAVKRDESVRYARKNATTYDFNQAETINTIDLYYNSQFENGPNDQLGQRKIFMNIGKFRTEVAAKQIDIDVKDFKFLPDDFSDPWTSVFLQKDFKEWAKDNYFGELINQCVDNLPKYGTVVLKKVGDTLEFVHLQNLRNDQTAKSLATSSYVIEEHPDMYWWEMEQMPNWNMQGLVMKPTEQLTVYERYGYVPREWLNKVNGVTESAVPNPNQSKMVDALVIMAYQKTETGMSPAHIFFAGEIKSRPYREAHWNRQYGRWLGIGVMEDLFENQVAKNIVANLIRRSMHWSSRRIMQTAREDVAAKNLVRDVSDGEILEVGTDGAITPIDLSSKNHAEFQQFLNEFERNSDQKAFTYEVATGEGMPSGTPFRLGVVLSNSVNAYFALKRENLGLFLKRVTTEFLVPQFLRDMGDQERTMAMFSGESGFEALKAAAMDMVREEAARISILTGNPIDVAGLAQAVEPFQMVKSLFFKLPPNYYKNAKFKFDLTITGEEVDVTNKLETLKALYFSMVQSGDPRSEKVLERITALAGENIAIFGMPGQGKSLATPNVNPSGANGGGNPGGSNASGAARGAPTNVGATA